MVSVGRFSWVQPGSRHLQKDPPSSLYSHGTETRTKGTNAFSALLLLDGSWFGEKKVHDQLFVMVLCLCFCLSFPEIGTSLTYKRASKQAVISCSSRLLAPPLGRLLPFKDEVARLVFELTRDDADQSSGRLERKVGRH